MESAGSSPRHYSTGIPALFRALPVGYPQTLTPGMGGAFIHLMVRLAERLTAAVC